VSISKACAAPPQRAQIAAAATLVRALTGYGHRAWAVSGLLALAACLADRGQPEEACRLWGLHDALAVAAPDRAQLRLEQELLLPGIALLSPGRREALRSLGAASTIEAFFYRAAPTIENYAL